MLDLYTSKKRIQTYLTYFPVCISFCVKGRLILTENVFDDYDDAIKDGYKNESTNQKNQLESTQW